MISKIFVSNNKKEKFESEVFAKKQMIDKWEHILKD